MARANVVRRWAHVKARAPTDIVLLGPPGVGKGTYGKLLSEWLGLVHLSSGDLIRDEIKMKTPLGKEVEPVIRRGDLLTDDVVMKLIKTRLESPDAQNGVLFDGFPRRAEQVPLLDTIREVQAALLLSLRESVLVEKAVNRRVCNKCNRGYNLAHIVEGAMRMPAILPEKEGVCDSCGGHLVHRSDDQPDTVRRRLEQSKELSGGVEKIYASQGKLFEFELTSGVGDMWPKLRDFMSKKVLEASRACDIARN